MKISAISLLIVGAIAWFIVYGYPNAALFSLGSLGPWWLLIYVVICGAVAWVPPLAGPLDRLLIRLRHPNLKSRTICSIAIAIAVTAYLFLTAVTGQRQFFPYIHDEFSYLIQAHQMACGHLWMPVHPLATFFDSFQLLVEPVYASAYFPGTALLYVPGVWLHCPPYVTSLVISGTIAGLLFWITAELLDAVAGFLAVLLLLSDGVYRELSILIMGQSPMLLYGLLATAAWLRWLATDRNRWLVFIGLFLGSAAVTRPVDALCFAIPLGLAVMLRRPKQIWIALSGMLPLLILQLILNHGITGHWLQTPFGLYADRDYPGTSYGFHPFDPAAKPASDLPQKQALYREYLPLLKEHRPGNILSDLLQPHGPFDGARLRLVLSQYSPVPFPLFSLLLPLSLLGLTRARGVVLATLPLFVLLYIPYLFFFPHYVLPAAPAVIFAVLLGAKALSTTWNSRRRFFDVCLTLLIAGLAIASFPQWAPRDEDVFKADLLASVNRQLASLPHLPAVVLFTYDPARNTHEEPVYNENVAWPDDAEVIRAHDLGGRNQVIFDYYALHQPARYFYRFDERSRTIEFLGQASKLGR